MTDTVRLVTLLEAGGAVFITEDHAVERFGHLRFEADRLGRPETFEERLNRLLTEGETVQVTMTGEIRLPSGPVDEGDDEEIGED